MTEEYTNYLEKTGVIAKLSNVLKLLYEMDEKPVNPLEYLWHVFSLNMLCLLFIKHNFVIIPILCCLM